AAVAAGDPPSKQNHRDGVGPLSDNQEDDGQTHRTFYLLKGAGPPRNKKPPLCRGGRSFEPGQTRWNRRVSPRVRLPLAEACTRRGAAIRLDGTLAQTEPP